MSPHLHLEPMAGTDTHLQDALKAAGLPTDDLSESGRVFFRFADQGHIVGFGGLERHGQDTLLRSWPFCRAARVMRSQ